MDGQPSTKKYSFGPFVDRFGNLGNDPLAFWIELLKVLSAPSSFIKHRNLSGHEGRSVEFVLWDDFEALKKIGDRYRLRPETLLKYSWGATIQLFTQRDHYALYDVLDRTQLGLDGTEYGIVD